MTQPTNNAGLTPLETIEEVADAMERLHAELHLSIPKCSPIEAIVQIRNSEAPKVAVPYGFIPFSETSYSNVGDSFEGSKITQLVQDLKRSMVLSSTDPSERAMMRLLDEIKISAYSQDWLSITIQTGRMCLPDGVTDAFQVSWLRANGTINIATWFKK